jgi:hypothetical protein
LYFRNHGLVSVPVQVGRNHEGEPIAGDELHAVSASGKLLWKSSFSGAVSFRAGRYAAPWTAGAVTTYRVGEDVRIAWALRHFPWWPSVLVTLDARGNQLGRFVHAGHMQILMATHVASGPVLVVGGISNSRGAAMLSVLDGREPFGTGPEEPGAAYECVGCSRGVPLRYFVFPPTEICRALEHPYNRVAHLAAVSGRVVAWTFDSLFVDGSYAADAEFTFNDRLELEQAGYGDSYWVVHRKLEKEGKLDHSDRDCPERKRPPRVREWQAEVGWRELTPDDPSAGGFRPGSRAGRAARRGPWADPLAP